MSQLHVEVFYITHPVNSADEAISLAEYLNRHGLLAYKSDSPDHAVEIPIECSSRDAMADRAATVHMVVSTWRMFWTHSDCGLFGLPIYSKPD